MFGLVEMPCGVLVFGRVTTAHMATFHAQSEMHPAIAHFQALFATFGVRRYLMDVTHMRASAHYLPPETGITLGSSLIRLMHGRSSHAPCQKPGR
jgi:hypothetical protein